MVSFIYVPIALITLATLLYYYFTRTFNYWKKRGIIGPEPVALFGNLKDVALRSQNIGVVNRKLYEAYPNERVVGVYRMTTPCLMIRDLDIIKNIMIKDFDLFEDRGIEFSKKGLGANLFHADGDTWRVLRNRFTPIFTSGKLKNMLYLMNERGDVFVKYVDELLRDEKPVQEVHKLVQTFTMATIVACAFGLDVNTQYKSETKETLKKIDRAVFAAKLTTVLDMMYPGILKKVNKSLFPVFITDFFNNLVKQVINERNGVPSNRKDFMDLILELRQQGDIHGTKRNADDKQLTLDLTDDVIAAQAFVFYAAGYETSATTMAFMLYELAMNPDVQDKMIENIDKVLEKHNGQVTYETLQDMTYMENVFDETLRKYPIVDLQRKAKVHYKVPGTDLTIPKGTTILVSPSGIHHDEKYYPDPEKFIPERHTPANSAERHTSAYLPFGVGPRNCIGMRFAKIQSRMCMTKFFSKFRVEACEETLSVMKMDPARSILAPKGGVTLKIVKRQ